MSETYLGQIITVGFDFAIRGYALCNGQTLPISQNQALYSLLGTTYGGNGQTTFMLPELRGRAPIHFGQRSGGSNFNLGQAGGRETVALTTAELPPHSHSAQLSGRGSLQTGTQSANAEAAPGNHLASKAINTGDGSTYPMYRSSAGSNVTNIAGLDTSGLGVTVGYTGNGQAVSTMSPYLAVNFQLSLQGIYPSRN